MMNRLIYFVLLCLLFGCADRAARTQEEPPRGPALIQTEEQLKITVDSQTVITYQLSPTLPDGLSEHYRRSGFLMAYSPDGRLVTDDFPVGHSHQHGIFTAWTNTTFRGEFHDFWNQQKELATVRHVELLETIEEGGIAGFRSRLQQVSLVHGPVLDEVWHVRVHDRSDPFVWDLSTEQTNITDDTLYLNQHVYGGLGVRGSAAWNEVDSVNFVGEARFLTSEGLERDSANHTRPDWTAIYGPLSRAGDTVGLAVLPHPENFRAPEFVRVHPVMPYLSVTPTVEAPAQISPGEVYRMRYRFIVFDGPVDSMDVGRFDWPSWSPE